MRTYLFYLYFVILTLTLNVNYDQRKYNSGYHIPFNFILLMFCSHLRKFKYNRVTSQCETRAPYRVAATIRGVEITKDSF